jgi:hypothetical protein
MNCSLVYEFFMKFHLESPRFDDQLRQTWHLDNFFEESISNIPHFHNEQYIVLLLLCYKKHLQLAHLSNMPDHGLQQQSQ